MNYNIIWRDKLGKITRQETLGQYIGRLLDKSKDYDLLNKSLDNIGITQDKQIINRVMEYRDKFSKKQNEALLSEITQKEEELKRIKDKQQDRGTSRGGFIR